MFVLSLADISPLPGAITAPAEVAETNQTMPNVLVFISLALPLLYVLAVTILSGALAVVDIILVFSGVLCGFGNLEKIVAAPPHPSSCLHNPSAGSNDGHGGHLSRRLLQRARAARRAGRDVDGDHAVKLVGAGLATIAEVIIIVGAKQTKSRRSRSNMRTPARLPKNMRCNTTMRGRARWLQARHQQAWRP
jgi:hypothetical protein